MSDCLIHSPWIITQSRSYWWLLYCQAAAQRQGEYNLYSPKQMTALIIRWPAAFQNPFLSQYSHPPWSLFSCGGETWTRIPYLYSLFVSYRFTLSPVRSSVCLFASFSELFDRWFGCLRLFVRYDCRQRLPYCFNSSEKHKLLKKGFKTLRVDWQPGTQWVDYPKHLLD